LSLGALAIAWLAWAMIARRNGEAMRVATNEAPSRFHDQAMAALVGVWLTALAIAADPWRDPVWGWFAPVAAAQLLRLWAWRRGRARWTLAGDRHAAFLAAVEMPAAALAFELVWHAVASGVAALAVGWIGRRARGRLGESAP
jgi:hypothetical protein